jgi:hypothetical protein
MTGSTWRAQKFCSISFVGARFRSEFRNRTTWEPEERPQQLLKRMEMENQLKS